MRKLLVAAFVSLDGVMQAPGGPEEDTQGGFRFGGWTVPYWDDAVGDQVGKTFVEPFDLLLGRKTYDIFANHWPRVENDQIADAFNACTKYVATSSTAPLPWQNSVALHDAAAGVAKLKAGQGPTLLVQGSSVLLKTLFAHGLVDELVLMTYPVVLGEGKRLFGETAKPAAWAHVETAAVPSGVTISRYRQAGAVQTGSFALDDLPQVDIAAAGQRD